MKKQNKEFNLSEKIMMDLSDEHTLPFPCLDIDDVKEFIKRLKEFKVTNAKVGDYINISIKEFNKLAGDELT